MSIIIEFENLANVCGYHAGDNGRLNLPATQHTADQLAKMACSFSPWTPGDDPLDIVITGAGPVWAYMAIAHALHGRARKLIYKAPNVPADGIVIFNHGESDEKV